MKRNKPGKTPEIILLNEPETLGSVDITAQLPKVCLQCPHQDFTVKVHRLYANEAVQATCVELACTNRNVCKYIMEMMKRDERNDAPPQ